MFKPGDKVMCIKKQFTNETVGKIYIVQSFDNNEELDLQIVKDDNGRSNTYNSRNFKLIERTEYYLPSWF